MKYMVDTNVFNRIVDGRLSREQLPVASEFVATYVQVEEINRTKDEQRRAQLFLTFAFLQPKMELTSSFIYGVSPWGLGAWGVGEEFKAIKAELDQRNGAKPNNVNDALIAETAMVNGYGLITADSDLAAVARPRVKEVVHIAF